MHIEKKINQQLEIIESKSYGIYIFIYILSISLSTVFFICSFRIFNKFFNQVPLVGTVTILFSICICILIILIGVSRKLNKKLLDKKDLALIFILCFFFNYNFYGMIPFNVSRSNSIILMGYLKSNSNLLLTKNEIERFVSNKYFNEYDAIGKRLNEQVAAGNIEKIEDKYKITKRGILIIEMFGYISSLYAVENNFADLNSDEVK